MVFGIFERETLYTPRQHLFVSMSSPAGSGTATAMTNI